MIAQNATESVYTSSGHWKQSDKKIGVPIGLWEWEVLDEVGKSWTFTPLREGQNAWSYNSEDLREMY